ncbi:hypothetical protein FCOIX_3893 [Fusarium coicis]|nr:hypothetical protein FCOIX_3893 [Fusarium coicis]
MISHNIFTATVVLLAAGLANAGPCRPSSVISLSTVVASVSETATSSLESETATSTVSIVATQTTTTATESESESGIGTTVIVETTPTVSSVETTTTGIVDTTTTVPAVTTAEATTTEATTTTEGPEAIQSIYIYGRGSNDPALASTQGKGFIALSDSPIPDVEYIDMTADTSSNIFLTLGGRSGKVNIGNGPNVGKLVGYFSTSDYSLAIALDGATTEDNGVSPIDCEIVQRNNGAVLQCQFGDRGIAEFWTCAGRFTLVRPGYDFTSKCPSASIAYKLDYVEVANV